MTDCPIASSLATHTTQRRLGRLAIGLATTLLSTTGCVRIFVDETSWLQAQPGPAADSAAMAAALPPGYTLSRLSIPVAKGIELTGVAATRPDAVSGVLFLGGATSRVRTDGAATLRALTAAAPVNVMLLDYPGSGTSGGAPTLVSVTAHAIAAYDWIAARPSLAPGGLIVHGHSFGGFVATSVADARTVRGLVLHGAATSARELAKESVRTWLHAWWTRPARPFIRIAVDRSLAREDNRVRLGRYRGPVLVLVGADDAVTPPSMSRSIAAASASPRALMRLVVLPGSDHQTLLNNPRFGDVYRTFLDSVVQVGRAAADSSSLNLTTAPPATAETRDRNFDRGGTSIGSSPLPREASVRGRRRARHGAGVPRGLFGRLTSPRKTWAGRN